MKKVILIFIFALFMLCGCFTTEPEPVEEHKPIDGMPPIFEEKVGFYSKDASIFEEGGVRHVYYTTNEVANTLGDVIAYRKGEYKNNTWVYSDRTIVLRPTEGTFDASKVSNPDVIKGKFAYNGESYDYLMAYAGNDQNNDRSYQIGMAVSKTPLGPWVKLDEPIVKYDEAIYGAAFGAGAPSLISHDYLGKVYLFYTFADIDLTSTRVEMMDLSNLNDIKRSTASDLSVQGLEDKDLGSNAIFNNADFAINRETNELIVVRDRNPLPSAPAVADSVQVVKSSLSIIANPIVHKWEIVKRSIDDMDTLHPTNDQLLGWQRVYSGDFITNEYGHISSKVEILLSVSCVQQSDTSDTAYVYTPALITVEVE